MTRAAPPVGIIAGSDPSGGAGLELDLKVLALHGIHGVGVASCLTFQTGRGMQGAWTVPLSVGRRRLELLLRDLPPRVWKVGMLPDAGWIELAATTIRARPRTQAVVDPVIAPTVGRGLLSRRSFDVLRRELLPAATLLTPNALEAAALLRWTAARVRRDPDAAARALLDLGPGSVLLKGGHLFGRSAHVVVDRLRGRLGEHDFRHPRQAGRGPRGTGCALASAIAAGFASGGSSVAAIERAIRWLGVARRGAVKVGAGRPVLGLVR